MNLLSEVALGHIPQFLQLVQEPPTGSMCLNQSETYGHILISYIAAPNFWYTDHRITRSS